MMARLRINGLPVTPPGSGTVEARGPGLRGAYIDDASGCRKRRQNRFQCSLGLRRRMVGTTCSWGSGQGRWAESGSGAADAPPALPLTLGQAPTVRGLLVPVSVMMVARM